MYANILASIPSIAVRKTNLVKALKQAQDSALDLILGERAAGAVHPHDLEALDLGHGGNDRDALNGGGESLHGGSGDDAGGLGGGAEDSGAEHFGRGEGN